MMNQRHFWIFKNKDQRRFESEQIKRQKERSEKERVVDVTTHTHLDHIGRKGFLGLERAMPSFVRHARNLIYAKWVRGKM